MPFNQYMVNDKVRIFMKYDEYSDNCIIEGTITEIEDKHQRYLTVDGYFKDDAANNGLFRIFAGDYEKIEKIKSNCENFSQTMTRFNKNSQLTVSNDNLFESSRLINCMNIDEEAKFDQTIINKIPEAEFTTVSLIEQPQAKKIKIELNELPMVCIDLTTTMIFFEEIIQASTSVQEIGMSIFAADNHLVDSVCIYSNANKKTYLFDLISIAYEQNESSNDYGKHFFSLFAKYFSADNVKIVTFDSKRIKEMLGYRYTKEFEAECLKSFSSSVQLCSNVEELIVRYLDIPCKLAIDMNEIDWSARPIDLKQKYLAKRYTSYLITVKEVISSLSRMSMTSKSLGFDDSFDSNERHKKLKMFLRSHATSFESMPHSSELDESSSQNSSNFNIEGFKKPLYENYICRPAGCPPFHNSAPKFKVNRLIQNFIAKYP